MNLLRFVGFLFGILGFTVGLGVSTNYISPREAFKAWSEQFGITATGSRLQNVQLKQRRFETFLKNFKFVRATLANENSFGMELNRFADMSNDELKLFTGLNVSEIVRKHDFLKVQPVSLSTPSSVDHRYETGLSVPRYQGLCGACWSFTTVSVFESRYKQLTDEIMLLSEQELVDCTYPDGRDSCNGGFMTNAFSYLKTYKRLSDRRDYHYEKKHGTCRKSSHKNAASRARVSSYQTLAAGDNNLAHEVGTKGPVAVAVHSARALTFYKYGVYDGTGCAGGAVNHAVVVVGYNSDRWIIRNSWGESWGMFGYAYFTRGFSNVCQISSFPVSATLIKTSNADDQCFHVPEHHRQPCWEVSVWKKDQFQCEKQGCCWDPQGRGEKCFVKAKITLYSKKNYKGVSATFYGAVNDLYEYDFKTIAHSLRVHYGTFIAYEKSDYGKNGGWSLSTLSRGGIADLEKFGANAAISSFRPLPGGEIITLFKDSHGRGESISIHKYKSNVGAAWNDKTSSVYSVKKVDICRDTLYKKCSTLSSGLTGTLSCNDCLSSVRLAV